MSLVGNGMNNLFIVKDFINMKDPLTDSVKKAQHILKRLDSRNHEEIAELARKMFKGVIKTNLTDGFFLRNVTNIVIDWDENIDKKSFADFKQIVREYTMVSKLLDWQKTLLSKLRNEEEVKKIYIFNDGIIDNFWILVDKPTTDIIQKCSDIYMEFLAENIDVICEFMVFNQNEINNYNFPEETIKIDCEV